MMLSFKLFDKSELSSHIFREPTAVTTKVSNSPHLAGPVMGVEGPRQQRPAGQQQKKKKKKTGNKW